MALSLCAQNYQGINSSRYYPLQNIYNQPADLIRSDRQWNINIVTVQLGLVNNMVFKETNFLKVLSRLAFFSVCLFFLSSRFSMDALVRRVSFRFLFGVSAVAIKM